MASDPRKSDPAAGARPAGGGWQAYLAINSSTGALLGAILLVCMGSELWGPFLPKYMRTSLATPILLIAVYGSFRDLLEAINYLLGGWMAGKLNTRRSLLLFNAAPLIGLLILLFWHRTAGVFLAVPFVFIWDSLAGPALLTVVGDSLPADRRAMAFSLQSLFRRVAKMTAYGITALIVLFTGTELGVQTAFAISFAVVLAGLFVQMRFMKTASKDAGTIIHQPLKVLRGFDPQLKRLLAADIFARLAEGMPRELIVLFTAAVAMTALGIRDKSAVSVFGALMIVSQVTSAITYLPMGAIASRPGFGKRPYIGLTFFFFATFPAVLAGMGWLAYRGLVPPAGAVACLVVAFIFMGMREVGEPARKAMIVDLIPPAQKTQCIGIYWSSRSAAVMVAPIVGGLIWIGANRLAGRPLGDATGPGPIAMLLASSLCGTIGVIYYYARFGKGK